ncbi:MAG: site-specific integrase, partial [Deltaproteobacteria bacterium]|nr:site-specific integrase [Deltaproteobacteria bacterium]
GHIKQLAANFGNRELKDLTMKGVEEYQAALLESGKAPATVNRYIDTLKHMYTKASEWDLISEEVIGRLRRVKHLKVCNRRLRYLSREEGDAVINSCVPHLRPIVVCALNTGMRKEEILSLEWEKHVDLRHGFILLDRTKNGERRELPINETLRSTLQGLVRRLNSPYVFTDGEGRRYRDIRRSFASACRRAGIKDFRFHDLRHTFASQLIMAGVDITTIKDLLGHKTLTMTLRYAHLAPKHLVNAVKVLDGYDLATLRENKKGAVAQTP